MTAWLSPPLLETISAIHAGPVLLTDVIFVLNDGDEPGLYGSQAFVQQHPWARDTAVVFDFDADAASGPSTLLWATPEDGWLVLELARARAGPDGLLSATR